MFDYPDAAGVERRAFLAGLHDDEIATVLSYTQTRRYAAGEVAVRSGASDRSVCIVTAGAFDVIGRQGRQARTRLDTLEPGDIFGELAFFDGLPRSADVVARGDSEAVVLTPGGFDRLRLNEPRLAVIVLMELGRALSTRLRERDRTGVTRHPA